MINFITAIVKHLDTKKSKTFAFYLIYIVVISILLFIGLSGNIHADTVNNQSNSNQQYQNQNKTVLVQKTTQKANNNPDNNDWFRDGLNNQDFKARGWISWHESLNNWKILNYGYHCIGYFQLSELFRSSSRSY